MAKNIGIIAADSKYVCFIDSDDYIDNIMMESLYNNITEHDADICFCNRFLHNNMNNEIIEEVSQIHCDVPFSINDNDDYFINFSYSNCNKIYKKSMFFDNNVFFRNNLFGEDFLLTFCLLPYAKKIVHVDKSFYYYVLNRPGSITSAHNSEKVINQIMRVVELLITFYKERGLYDKLEDPLNSLIVKYLLQRTRDSFYNKKSEYKNSNVFVDFLDKNFSEWKKYLLTNNESLCLYKYIYLRNLSIFNNKSYKDKPNIIFSASKGGKNMLEFCRENNIKIVAFCDNSIQKQGQKIEDIIIMSPEKIIETYGKDIYFLYAADSMYYNDVKNQLNKLGINDDNIL